MASPFGHTLVSCYFIEPHAKVSGRKPSLWSALFLMVLASLADLDIFFGPKDFVTSLFHRTISHSFFSALWLGCVIALIEALLFKGPLLKRAALYAAVLASHPLLDYFAVIPPYVGAMPLFWPFSWNYYASPVALLPNALTYNSGIPVAHSLTRTFGSEMFIILPMALWQGALVWKARRARAAEVGGRQAALSFARIDTTGV